MFEDAATPPLPCHAQLPIEFGWEFAGPTTYVNPHVKGPLLTSGGAVQDVAGGTTTWFIGSVNGGVWRSRSLQETVPKWENVLDGQPVTCSSISALHVSQYDSNVVYAGCGGSTSSEQGYDWNVMNSGDWTGIMKSDDDGDTWFMIDDFPTNYYVTNILEPEPGNLLVSAQSHLYDRNDGGIWYSSSSGGTFTKVSELPTFTFTVLPGDSTVSHILATHPRNAKRSVSLSVDGGRTFSDYGSLPWATGAVPFYTCATAMADGAIVVAGLTWVDGFEEVNEPQNANITSSQFFIRHSHDNRHQGDLAPSAWVPIEQPMSMDVDVMPKDRMAILGDPKMEEILYVAGNAAALVWRVNVTAGEWTEMWGKDDVPDESEPHCDVRNLAWDPVDSAAAAGDVDDVGRLLLVSDGGIFAREGPRSSGGRWVSLNGDYGSMELVSARYDPSENRFVAGAQDNCVIITPPNTESQDVGYCLVMGDGTITQVDSKAQPSRFYGAMQFLGVGATEHEPGVASGDDDDDDDCGGFCFAQGDMHIKIPIGKYFPEASSFPYFVHPFVLNQQDPTKLQFWANGTIHRPSAFYELSIPYSVSKTSGIPPPKKVVETRTDANILAFTSGGFTEGKADPTLLIGMSHSHLFIRGSNSSTMVERPLPVVFAEPVIFSYDDSDEGLRILGPVTHGKTVSLSVSPSDSNVVAVTGWPSVDNNEGDEVVFITFEAGKSWVNITGNLREASGVVGKVRPGGVLIMDLSDGSWAVFVGTSTGLFVTFLNLAITGHDNDDLPPTKWTRFGTCDEFPIVLTADLDYEPISDRLIAATYGRGIYYLGDAKAALVEAKVQYSTMGTTSS